MPDHQPKPVEIDPDDVPVWGAEGLAPIINRSLRQTYHLLKMGYLPATKVGPLWTSTRRRLRRAVGGEVEWFMASTKAQVIAWDRHCRIRYAKAMLKVASWWLSLAISTGRLSGVLRGPRGALEAGSRQRRGNAVSASVTSGRLFTIAGGRTPLDDDAGISDLEEIFNVMALGKRNTILKMGASRGLPCYWS
jgi:hypothetical protein